jgi:hypothetical protein
MNLQSFARDFPELFARIVGTHPVYVRALALAGLSPSRSHSTVSHAAFHTYGTLADSRAHWRRMRAVAADIRRIERVDYVVGSDSEDTSAASGDSGRVEAETVVLPSGNTRGYIVQGGTLSCTTFTGLKTITAHRLRRPTNGPTHNRFASGIVLDSHWWPLLRTHRPRYAHIMHNIKLSIMTTVRVSQYLDARSTLSLGETCRACRDQLRILATPGARQGVHRRYVRNN